MACQSADPPPDANTPQQLDLAQHTQDHLNGKYSFHGTTVGFAFEHTNERDSFVLTGADGRELMRQVKTGATLETSVFGGAAKTVADLAIIRESARQADLPESQRVPFDAEKAVVSTGNQQLFAQFETTPEAAIMPWLSRELGIRGFDGRSYPLTVRMHVISSNIAQQLHLE
ncbi:MAG TPA: hypothetical protein VGO00_19015, partial [Kofleriaceae bacterium]|nr:hypothetical protein [Kofleriaceae bacterium]